jgi:hypothetical protein
MPAGTAIVASVVGVSGNAVIKAIELGWSRAREGTRSEQEARGELRNAQELALHYWGCLLYEMRAGCERVRYMVEAAAQGITFGVFDFSVSDAVMSDFCRVAPSPRLLESFQSVLAALKRVDFFQRAAVHEVVNVSGAALEDEHGTYRKGLGFALDAARKDIYGRFNGLVRLGNLVGESVYGKENWAGDASGLLPDEINTSAPIDHGRI